MQMQLQKEGVGEYQKVGKKIIWKFCFVGMIYRNLRHGAWWNKHFLNPFHPDCKTVL